MPKSKFQLKAQKSVSQAKAQGSKGKGKTRRPKYYDEDMVSSSKSSSGSIVAIGLIAIIVIGGGITGILLTQDPNDGTTTTTTTTSSTTTTNDPTIFIEPGDHINLHYRLWTAEPQSGLEGVVDMTTPVQDDTFEVYALKSSLINGFYYEILGMGYLEEKTFSIDACRDEKGDGLDDYTGQEPLGYYDPTDPLYDTNLVFYVQLTYISKA